MESKGIKLPKTKRGMDTLNKIVKAAEKVFGSKGYYGTMINDIANKAKVAPGTIYIYFTDKLSLYCYLLKRYSHFIRKYIADRIEGCKDRKEAERIGLIAFLEIIKDKPYMYNIIWGSLFVDKKLFVNYYESFSENYSAKLEESKKRGEIKDFDPVLLSYVLMGISNFVGLKYVMFNAKSSDEVDLEKIADEVINMLDQGIFK